MSLASKYFKEVCERCENHANNMDCEDMITCPAYKLYCMAKAKKKVVVKHDEWNVPPPPPTGWI